MRPGRIPPRPRFSVLVPIVAAIALGTALLAGAPADAQSANPAQNSGTRASGLNAPLALAGFAVLSGGLFLLGFSRTGGRPRPEALPFADAPSATLATLRTAYPADRRTSTPPAAAVAPLSSVAGALHATADALQAIATELPSPSAEAVAASAERVREAQITLARWLEDHR